MSDNLRTDLQILPRRADLQILPRRPDRAWECNLCGAKFDSEMSKDFHMTRCTASETDAAMRSPDEMIRVANRFPGNPYWEVLPYQGNPANPAFLGSPNDFSAPVGPKRDLAQPQPPSPQDSTQAPDFIMRKLIQYPPKSGNQSKPPVTSRPIAPYLTDGPPNPLFQNSNIQNVGYRQEFKPNLPLQQASRTHYAPRGIQQQLAFRAPLPNAPLPSHIHTTPQTSRLRPSPSDPTTNAIHTNQVPSAAPLPNHIHTTPQTSRMRPSPSDPTTNAIHTNQVPSAAPLPNHIHTTPQTSRMRPSPSDPTTNAIHTNPTPPFQQRAIYNEPSTSKLYSTRSSEDASVYPRPRRADGKLDVLLVWQKQQPTLETELRYFGEKEEMVTFSWDRRKELFLAQTRLSPGEHSGNLLIPDTDKFLAVKPFVVSPHSVGVQEIKVDLVDIAVSSNPAPQTSKTASSTKGLDTAPSQEANKSEHQVLPSQHRPLFHPVRAPGEKRDTQREKSRTFLVNPLERTMEREVAHTPPYLSLPHSFEVEEEPLPFQNNTPRERTVKERDRMVPVVQLAYPQREEQVATADKFPSQHLQMNMLKQQTVNGFNEPSRKLEGTMVSERDRKLEGNMVSERDRKLEGERKMVSERERKLEGERMMVSERDRKLEGERMMVLERDRKLEGERMMVSERDRKLEGERMMVLERERKMEGTMVSERERKLEGTMTSERDRKLEGTMVSERDRKLDGERMMVSERDRKLEGERMMVSERERKLEGERMTSERERRMEIELDEWIERFRKTEASNRTAENENNILKREVNQLKTRYVDTLSKQENRKREVDELRLSLVQAKEEMDNLRGETSVKLQQSERLERERERRHSEAMKLALGEKENYKRAAYRYREEREKTKSSLEEMARAYGEYKQKFADVQNSLSQVQQQLKQQEETREQLKRQNEILETELSYLKKIHKQNSNEIKAGDETSRYKPDREPSSLDSFLEKSSPEKKPWKVSYTRASDSVAPANPYFFNPQASPTTDITPPFKKKLSVLSQVHLFEKEEGKALGDNAYAIPRITPRVSKASSSKGVGQGVERYNPNVLTAFLNKSTSLSYKSSSVKAINLSYLMKPDSHTQKQVLVKIKEQYMLGLLRVVFSVKHPYLGKTGIAGVELQEAVGTSDGIYESVQYFDCATNHAIFASISEVFVPVL